VQETLGAKAFLKVAKDNKPLMNSECAGNSFGEEGWGVRRLRRLLMNLLGVKTLFPRLIDS